jgi:hypothetical protein
MIFKDFTIQIKDVTNEGLFTGYAAVFNNEDLGGDVITPGAFTKTIAENPSVPILWGHNSDEVIGVNSAWKEDSKGLKVEGQLIMDVQRAKEARSLMQAKAVKGLSIGYDPVVIDWSREKEGIRTLKEIKVWEYSLTPFPMNPKAQVTAVKCAKDFEEAVHQMIVSAKQASGPLSAEQKSLIEQAIEQLSALRAAKAPGVATQYNIALEALHAMDSIQSILRGE